MDEAQKHPVSEKLCFLVFRIPHHGQSPEAQKHPVSEKLYFLVFRIQDDAQNPKAQKVRKLILNLKIRSRISLRDKYMR
jgi:hypothetical protein